MKTFTREMPLNIPGIDIGWGNGYVIIPKGHSMHGKEYDDIDVKIHGGLTFAKLGSDIGWDEITEEDKDGWVVGFDTAHACDNPTNQNKSYVIAETENLKNQLEKL